MRKYNSSLLSSRHVTQPHLQLGPCELHLMSGVTSRVPLFCVCNLKVLKTCQLLWIAVILKLRARDNAMWSRCTPMLRISPQDDLIGVH